MRVLLLNSFAPGVILPTPQGIVDTGDRQRIQDVDSFISFYFRYRRSIAGFFRFFSNRKYGAQIASQGMSSRKI